MDYKKELGDSAYSAFKVATYTSGIGYGLKKAGLISQPCVKFDLMDVLKLAAVMTLATMVDDYAIYKKWYPEKISK